MIHAKDLWQLEFLSTRIKDLINANTAAMEAQDFENSHQRGIAFGINLVNKDLLKVKETLDQEIERLQKKAESPFMIDDLNYEEEMESA